jgi:predicted DNA-binding transcriptional regulator YafY
VKSSRLLSILLLLQTHGRMTAARLAAELEVSERTVYRDVLALHAAGVPLYADAGHRGGYRLLEGYRTRLTGLNAGEAEALFLSGAPGPAADLGFGPALASAQLKLRAALPPELRVQADRLRTRFLLDAPGWYADDADLAFLPQVADAVWRSRAVEVRYRRWKEPTDVDRRLEPYGLVLKAGRWYAVAGPGPEPRTYRVDQILRLTATEDGFEVPDGFVLADFWRGYQDDFHTRLHQADAVVLLAPSAAERLTGAAARAFAATGTTAPGGRMIRATLPIESQEQALALFLSLGVDVEVLAPPDLRARLAATVRDLARRYASPPPP